MFEDQTPQMQEFLRCYLQGAHLSAIETGMRILSSSHSEPFELFLLVLLAMQDERTGMSRKASQMADDSMTDDGFTSWEKLCTSIAVGQTDLQDGLAFAEDANLTPQMPERAKMRRIESNKCQILYYAGARAAIHGQTKEAANYLRQAAQLGFQGLLERRLATAQLDELGFPPQ